MTTKKTTEQIQWEVAEKKAKKLNREMFKRSSRLTVKMKGAKRTGCQYLVTEVDAANEHAKSIGGVVVQDTYKPTFTQSKGSKITKRFTAKEIIETNNTLT